MNQELEVGQVWKDDTTEREVLKVKYGQTYFYYTDIASGESGVDELSIDSFKVNNTLIRNPDGTNYVVPNDYQAGDVWRHKNSGETFFVSVDIDRGMHFLHDCAHLAIHADIGHSFSIINFPDDYELVHRKREEG